MDADGTVEDTSDDPWHYLAYDERWRLVARFTDTDTDPTEQWVHHQAGLNGAGGGSYIDGVIMRERDTDANGSLDERVYILQNWRADVIALTDTYGIPLEHIRYDAYGQCFNIDPADWTTQGASSGNKGYGVPDGIITSADINYYVALYNASDAKSDVTTQGASQGTANYGWPDGTVTSADISYYSNMYTNSENTGRGNLSRTDINNRLGYAGYTRDVAVNLYHVRNRVYSTELGRWTRRGPGTFDGGPNPGSVANPCLALARGSTIFGSWCSGGNGPPDNCLDSGSYESCLSCCSASDWNQGIGCAEFCLQMLNPNDATFPGDPGPNGQACQTACSNAANPNTGQEPFGVNTCAGGNVVSCVCAGGLQGILPPWGSPVEDDLNDCTAFHELINEPLFDCTGVPDGHNPNPAPGAEDAGACNEAAAFLASAACASSISCTDPTKYPSKQKKCVCQAASSVTADQANCMQTFWQGHCDAGTHPTLLEVDAEADTCGAAADTRGQALYDNCMK